MLWFFHKQMLYRWAWPAMKYGLLCSPGSQKGGGGGGFGLEMERGRGLGWLFSMMLFFTCAVGEK